MALNKTKLGMCLTPSDLRNSDGKLGEDDVRGISTGKAFISTKADLTGVNLLNYKVVLPGMFAYVADTSRRGEKISLAYNDSNDSYLVSSISTVFEVRDEKELLSYYLFIFFNRPEFDRYSRFNSWGSARETFDWETMCGIDIELPDIETQQKFVNVYKAMVANQQAYEKGLDDLKLTCDAYIENLRRKMPCEKIGNFIYKSTDKNTDGAITLEQGINIQKKFITPQRANSNLTGRQIVRTGEISYCTQLNNENVAVAYREGPDCVVSGVYDVIGVNDKTKLLPKYLMLWLTRREFGRFVYWASTGSAYEFLSFENLANYEIPVPDINVQQSIVDIYECFLRRDEINVRLKAQIKDLCPILIRGSLQEGGKTT